MTSQLVTPFSSHATLVGADLKPLPGTVSFMTRVASALNGKTLPNNIAQIVLGNGVTISTCAGSPNHQVAGNIGDLCLNLSGGAGTTLYVKESGAPGAKTGWGAK